MEPITSPVNTLSIENLGLLPHHLANDPDLNGAGSLKIGSTIYTLKRTFFVSKSSSRKETEDFSENIARLLNPEEDKQLKEALILKRPKLKEVKNIQFDRTGKGILHIAGQTY